MSRNSAVALPILLGLLLGGCLGDSMHQALPIPAGAQHVQVVVTASKVVLNPAVVDAGNIYFVLDNENGQDSRLVTIVRQEVGIGESLGGLPPVDLTMLALCTVEQRAIAERGRDGALGYCGAEVVRATLDEGTYIFVLRGDIVLSDTGDGTPFEFHPIPDGEVVPMAVLEVLP